jgi:hypothetical protein
MSDPTSSRWTRSGPEGVVQVWGELTLERIFTEGEAALVRELRTFAKGWTGRYAADLADALETGFRTLAPQALALESYPSLKDPHVLGGRARTYESLMEALVRGGEHGLEWVLPSKAVLSRAFGIAKVNFFTALSYALQGSDAAGDLLRRIEEAVEEAVYTRLAEELYASFITSRTAARNVKVSAAQQLIDMWDGRLGLVTTRFCPILRSAWAARTRAERAFGTLLGVAEIVQLLFQDCDEKFVAWFSAHAHDSEQRQAFEEFVFDLPFESLEQVRQRMLEESKTCVSAREVERYLGLGEGNLRPLVGGPKALYVSFRRRRVKAQYRTSMRAPGPKQTAEAFILSAVLREASEGKAG